MHLVHIFVHAPSHPPSIAMIHLTINNQPTDTAAPTLAALSEELQLPQRGVAVAVNNRIAPRADWPATALADGDAVTIIKAAFGG